MLKHWNISCAASQGIFIDANNHSDNKKTYEYIVCTIIMLPATLASAFYVGTRVGESSWTVCACAALTDVIVLAMFVWAIVIAVASPQRCSNVYSVNSPT